MIDETLMFNLRNIRRTLCVVALSVVATSAGYAAPSPDSYTFKITATIIEPQCRWVHEGNETVELGELTAGTAVDSKIAVGRMKGVCDGKRTTPFGFTVGLKDTGKWGLTHKLWDTTRDGEIKAEHKEKMQDEVTELSLITTGTPTQAGEYLNNMVMTISYD